MIQIRREYLLRYGKLKHKTERKIKIHSVVETHCMWKQRHNNNGPEILYTLEAIL